MPDVGDRVRVASTKVGQAPRDGVVTRVIGSLLRISWSTGEESTVAPGPGVLAVIGKVRATSGRRGTAPKKAAKAAKSAKKVKESAQKAAKKRAPARKAAEKRAPARKAAKKRAPARKAAKKRAPARKAAKR